MKPNHTQLNVSNTAANQIQVSNILIDGATGYIGSHLTATLKQAFPAEAQVRCLVRSNADNEDVTFLENTGAQIFQSDLDGDVNTLENAFQQVDIACHLIGSIAPKRGETSASLHIEQTERFVQSCRKGGVKKIIMVSACGAAPEAKSNYHRTKWQAEQIIKGSGINAIILRPSLLIGRTAGKRNSKLITRLENLIRNKRLVPLIGGGGNKLQPLFIDDLIAAILTCIFSVEGKTGELTPTLELGGVQVLTLRELTQLLMQTLKIERPIFDLPIPMAKIIALFCEATQEVPLISRDQIILSQKDNVCIENRMEQLINRPPMSITKALSTYRI